MRLARPATGALPGRLTAKDRKGRNEEYGEVRWGVSVTNQEGEQVAAYEDLTMNAM